MEAVLGVDPVLAILVCLCLTIVVLGGILFGLAWAQDQIEKQLRD